jgi:hypothetical protein
MNLHFMAWPRPRTAKSSTVTRENETHVEFNRGLFRIAQPCPGPGAGSEVLGRRLNTMAGKVIHFHASDGQESIQWRGTNGQAGL